MENYDSWLQPIYALYTYTYPVSMSDKEIDINFAVVKITSKEETY